MKILKRTLSVILVLSMFVYVFPLICSANAADESDIVQCRGWSTPDSNYYNYIYEVVLDPRYVKYGNVKLSAVYYDGDEKKVEENYANYRLEQRDIEDFGSCYVISVVTKNQTAYLQPNSFFDKDGNGNKRICLTNSKYYTHRCAFNVEPSLRLMKYVVEQGTCTKITFDEKGSVIFGGKTLAENVNEYTLEYTDPGEQELILTVNGLTVMKYNIAVKTAEQMREDKIAELKKDLSRATEAFFESLPIAIVTLPLAPLAIFGFLWPFAPIEIGGHIFDIISEIIKLRLQR
ncbi:MAG: hypothetical protein K5756_07040 [Clostridiales bacterium]|nr:hypothetical protein [Clostridiales bacterium]